MELARADCAVAWSGSGRCPGSRHTATRLAWVAGWKLAIWNWPVRAARCALVDDQQIEVSVGLEDGIGGQILVAARGLHDIAPSLNDLRGKLLGEVSRIWDIRARRRRRAVGAADQAVVALLPPAVEARRVIAARLIVIPQVPDVGAVVGRLEQRAERVGQP